MSLFDRFKKSAKSAPEARPMAPRTVAPTRATLEARELFLGVTEGNSRYVRQLLGRGCDPQAEAAQGTDLRSPLHVAAQLNHLGVTMALLDGGADVDAQDDQGATPLLVAVRNYPNSLAVIEVLEFAAADANISDNTGMSAFRVAASTDGFPRELLEGWMSAAQETGPLAVA